MLSNPEKRDNQYFCNIESSEEFVEKGQILIQDNTGENRYIADLNNENITETFEELLLNELKSKASEWFDISPQVISRFFLFSGDSVVMKNDCDDIEDQDIHEDKVYEIRFRPSRLLIDKSSFQVEYSCYSIEEDVIDEDGTNEEGENNEEANEGDEHLENENINLIANLNILEHGEATGETQNGENRQFSIIDETQDINIDTIEQQDRQQNQMDNFTREMTKRDEILQKIRELRIQSTMLQIQANKMEQELYNQE